MPDLLSFTSERKVWSKHVEFGRATMLSRHPWYRTA